jgi:hypothetical protein
MPRSLALGALWAAAWLMGQGGHAQEAPPVVGVPAPPPAAALLGQEAAAREEAWVRRTAALYGSPAGLLRSLRALGLDHVETECAVAVSTRAQRPIQEVLALRKAGMEWGEVALSYGFTLLEAIRETPAEKRKTSPPSRERSRP